MYKKFLNAILFGALILGSAGTITSCKDYDDEIDEINARISGLSSLTDQLSGLQATVATATNDAKKASQDATTALTAAQDALAAASDASDSAAKAAAEEAIAASKIAEAAASAAEAAKTADAANTALSAAQKAAEAAQKAAEAAKKAAEASKADATAAAKAQAETAKAAADDALKAAADAMDKAISDAMATTDANIKAAAEQAVKDAVEAANKAIADNKVLTDAAIEASINAAQDAADKAVADAKTAVLGEINQKIEDLQNQINAGVSETDWNEITRQIEQLTAEVMKVIGHRLQSLSVVANAHINGIAAITMTSLQYVPQKHEPADQHEWDQAKHATRPVVDHKDITDKAGKSVAPVYLTTKENTAYFHVSPNLGVTKDDIKDVAFNNIQSDNTFTRADFDFEKGAGLNELLVPTEFDINNSVMEVKYKKADPSKTITSTLNKAGTKETFQMVSLRAQIADKNLAEDEKETGAFVNSEYVRVEELFKAPYIAHAKQDWDKVTGEYADEVQKAPAAYEDQIGEDGLFVHYHDSLCLYDSKVNRYVDIMAQYDKTLNLKDWVTICTVELKDGKITASHTGHEHMTAKEAEAYGLEFRFFMPETPYITLGGPEGNSNETDQQKFATVTKDGEMTSHIYGQYTNNRDAVGREPIVRVELWDKTNENLIDVRYIKVKWVQETGKIEINYEYPAELYVCGDYKSLIGTKDMNLFFYANPEVKEGGMSKAEFHAAYTEANFIDGDEDYGKVKPIPNTQSDVDSYNIEWTITHADFLKKYKTAADWAKADVFEFTKTFTWTSATNKTLVVNLKKKIYKPAFSPWGYDNRYWRNITDKEYTTFNVNPIVFDTKESNPAWGSNDVNNATSNIYTDLLNGFVDDLYKKPILGAEGAVKFSVKDGMSLNRYFNDKDEEKYLYTSGKNYYYSEDYGNEAISDEKTDKYGFVGTTWSPKGNPASRGVVRTPDYAAYENVRFVFDAQKLKSNNELESDGVTKKYEYQYYDAATGKYKTLRATVSEDGTKLYINKELAAEIINAKVNNLPADADHPERAEELTYNIRLQEANPEHAPFSGDVPTEAAKALVGKLVPIKMVANICNDDYAVVTIKAYDAYIIEPLKSKPAATEYFTDATIGGSTIDVRDANIYDSWNADAKGNYYPVVDPNKEDKLADLKAYIIDKWTKEYKYSKAEATAIAELAVELGKFYEATDAVWDTKNIKTNLIGDGEGNLVPDWTTKKVTNLAGEEVEEFVTKDGPVPSNTEVVYDGTEQTLTYHNYSGTPVNNDYMMFIPVTYGYKWKTQVTLLPVLVKGNAGTADNQGEK